MLAYSATKVEFLDDAPVIEDLVFAKVKEKLNISPGAPEVNSWRNSLGNAMSNVLRDPRIPDKSGVAIEYKLNSSRHRIDFLISGKNSRGKESLIIVELKQWSEMQFSELNDHVKTFVGKGLRDERHPSYQAWSYSSLLKQFNEYVYENELGIRSCAYLHNCLDGNVVRDSRYENYLRETPVFLKGEYLGLRDFISDEIKVGCGTEIIERVDASQLRPSKHLAESISGMLEGIEEFVLIDEQKTVLEKIIAKETQSRSGKKQVLIVNGGPGTGKSVISLHALASFTGSRKNARYVTPNAAPRMVFESKLKQNLKGGEAKLLFSGSDAYAQSKSNDLDVLIIDEAHRIKKQSRFRPSKDSQIHDVINAARTTVFFIDNAQKVTWADIGEIEKIEEVANQFGAEVEHLELVSQFRCSGSDDYMTWVDNLLNIHENSESYFTTKNFDFKIFDNPNELFEAIKSKNKVNNKSRMVAGYCWDWVSKKDLDLNDIEIGTNFKAKWNLETYNDAWLINENSINEVGCIHTAQGLEVDYVGVIVGSDMSYKSGKLLTHPENRAKTDKSLNGFKKQYGENPTIALQKADEIIRNTYRTLFTRGMKGCYVYFEDKGLRDYFKSNLPS